ncbi:MAG: EpsD family peptidyl-prolyl cis-trans isomerase [Thiobacillaceae bacterium]
MNHSKKLLVLTAVLSVALTACGQKKVATPAAMKVNGEIVTAAELENQLEESGMTPGSENPISGKMMKAMIDKELLRQAAVKDNLDKDPRVAANLASTRRMILASAYMRKQIETLAKPTDAEVTMYFKQNPDFFANRKLYDLQEVVIKGRPENEAEIRAKLAGGINLKDFVAWLAEKNIPNSNDHLSAGSDQMREAVANKLKDAPVGRAIPLDDPNQIAAVFINAVQTQPFTLAQAAPMIAKRLYNKKIGDTMQTTLSQLRGQAKVEYVAPFTENGKSTTTEP